ncbi:hypothetical protein V0R50_21160 [Pseudomonas sp. 148P]|uniref:Uncharacterized protein n=1 Tax=Pseudomonas ulcerans TaxID=3115852 RepID=A0ABU7HWC8_9PSED|nr:MULTISPECIES: hypothetical protein [unclassified Pseudomonas]MEE1922898.1 hypothetical protein [Pseudomonas sp. 147P]MEE1935748.1 hypothetical protein [Pseudomonas sp. 148P]
MAKVIVVFTGSWRGYSRGEVAGFEEDVAQSLIDGGRAELREGKKGGKSGSGKGKPAPAATQPGPSTEPPVPDPDSDGAEDDEGKP